MIEDEPIHEADDTDRTTVETVLSVGYLAGAFAVFFWSAANLPVLGAMTVFVTYVLGVPKIFDQMREMGVLAE